MRKLRPREGGAPSSIGNNVGLTLDGSAQAMPLVSDRLKGVEPLSPTCFLFWRRELNISFPHTGLFGSTQVLQARLWELEM